MGKLYRLVSGKYLDMSSIIFPVGWLYLSYNNVDPNTFLYGTWVRVGGHYLMGADPSTTMEHKTAGGTTGSWKPSTDNHTLTAAQSGLPKHSHGLTKQVPYGVPYNDSSGTSAGAGGGTFYHETYFPPWNIDNAGPTNASEGHSHKLPNYPVPTIFLNIWRRSA